MWLSTRRKLNWAINWSYPWSQVPGKGNNSNERFLNEKCDGTALNLRKGWPAGMHSFHVPSLWAVIRDQVNQGRKTWMAEQC